MTYTRLEVHVCLFLGCVHTIWGDAEWNPLGFNSSK